MLAIQYLSLKEIIPYNKNPRKNERAIKVVMQSISEFGFKNPIIVDQNKVIIAGHTRYSAAQQLGLKEVPVIIDTEMTPEKVDAYRIMDNKSSEYSRWEWDLLREEFLKLQKTDYDLLKTGFTEAEIKRILNLETDEANIGNKPPKYEIVVGEIYTLGNHKIMCGDSTKPETYMKLMPGEFVNLVYTDPPYGVSYSGINNPNGRDWKVIDGDDLRNDELYNMLYASFKEVAQYLTKDGALYIFHASANQILFEKALNEAGFQVKQQLIWKKHHVLGHSHYHWNHEPLFYCSRKDINPVFYGDRSNKTTIGEMDPDKMDIEQMRDYIKDLKAQSTCQSFDKDATKDYIHPTQKPVKMAEQFIVNSSKVGDLVLDMYAVSGSTLIACEKLKRRCRMIELDPTFVSHIIERWETLTARRALNDKGELLRLK